MNESITEYLTRIEKKAHAPMQAVIREAECIGCMKCLPACPVDAIVGAAKQMHTVIVNECTGCELCVEPCPVDCIDMILVAKPADDISRIRTRFAAHAKRMQEKTPIKTPKKLSEKESLAERKAYILAALERVKMKRITGQ